MTSTRGGLNPEEELWCPSDLRHDRFCFCNAVVELFCDEIIDPFENHREILIKGFVQPLNVGERYLNWANYEEGRLDPHCYVCREKAFKISYVSGLHGVEMLVGVLSKNIDSPNEPRIKRFILSLVQWADHVSEYRLPPFEQASFREIESLMQAYGSATKRRWFR